MTLLERITDFANLHDAYIKARRGKRYRTAILKFGCNLEENLLSLRQDLVRKTYAHGGYREFTVTDSKKRTIKAAPFRDRVVHHAVCNVIEPILDKGFIYDSYACRTGKGTHAAVKRLERFIQSLRTAQRERRGGPPPKMYCLRCDISKYFESVDRWTLLAILRRRIGDDPGVVWLLQEIIGSNTQGIPIGNLTSQLFANVYLNELDHYVKRVLRERHYIRYMDDFLILGFDKKHLSETRERISCVLREHLKLELHPRKATIFPIDKGVDFLGYIVHPHYRLLRKSTVKRFLNKRRRYAALARKGALQEERIRDADVSWRAYAQFARSYRLMKSIGIDRDRGGTSAPTV